MNLRLSVLSVLASLALAQGAAADAQTDLTTPTQWRWLGNTTLQNVTDSAGTNYRIVDIEVESVAPFRLSAVMVRNAGDYAKPWWWYHGLTASQVSANLAANQARLIDIEPYETIVGIRYAAVMIPNAGSDQAAGHGWQTNHSFGSFSTWLQQNPGRRIIDVQPYRDAGLLRYAFTWVTNSGQTQSASWIYLNTTESFIESRLTSNNARLIDLEPHDDTGRFSAIMVPNDGELWFRAYDMGFSDVSRLSGQYAGRITDLQRYRLPSGTVRYAMIGRRNDNDLAIGTTVAMRAELPLSATSGFLLREYQGTASTFAGVFENRVFEPASLIKTIHHFVANWRVAAGLDSFNANVVVNQGLSGSCPNGTNPVTLSLSDVLLRMMTSSSNAATEAIRTRYGEAAINFTALAYGAENFELNHVIGCYCAGTPNEITLMDLANIHEAVTDGALGSVRDDFYQRMDRNPNFGLGSVNTNTIMLDELFASDLNAGERQAFLAGTLIAHKAGGYQCVDGVVRSRGAYVRLPSRTGCDTNTTEYFIGAWVNDAPDISSAEESVGAGLAVLFRERLRAAIHTWENASCDPFENYCPAEINSTGLPGACIALGTPYIVQDNLRINAADLPPNAFASIIFGTQRAFVPNPGGSAGNLCVGGSIGRLYSSLGLTSATGTIQHFVNNGSLQTSSGQVIDLDPGDKLMFQWWSRDASPTGPTSTFTDAVEVTFI